MRSTGRRYGFLTAAAVAAVTLWASASSSMNYPLYAEHWQLAPWVTTAMFAAYPLALIPMLLVFGNLSDYIGRRTAILGGLAAIVLGGVALGLAPWVWVVFLGRVLLGLGVGLALSPATAAVMEFGGPDGARRAGSTVSAATAVGLTLAMFVGGTFIEFAPAPMVLNQWVLVLVALAVFASRSGSPGTPRTLRRDAGGPAVSPSPEPAGRGSSPEFWRSSPATSSASSSSVSEPRSRSRCSTPTTCSSAGSSSP